MANDISMGGAPKTGVSPAAYESILKASGEDATKLKEVVSKAMEVLAGVNLRVTKSDTPGVDGAAEKKTNGATNVPALDNPDDVEQLEANLAKLVAFLELDNEERQTKMTKDRIELQKSKLDVEHDGRMKEIDKSIQKMKDAEKAAKMNRIFGWLGAILAVVTAVVLTVVTGGAAAGFAIAGAAIAVSSLVMNETGLMDKLTDKLADHLEKTYGMNKNKAKLAASLIINLTIMAASLACSIGGMVSGISAASSAAAKAAETGTKIAGMTAQTAKSLLGAVTVTNTAVSAGALLGSGIGTYYTKRSEDAKADVTELEKFITMLQQRLDESNEELQILLQQIEAGLSKIAELITSATDTSEEIARNLGAMA